MTVPSPMPALPAELSIYTAAETRAAWLAWLAADDAASGRSDAAALVDASAVDVVDGAGVQLLISLRRTLHDRGIALALSAPSRVLQDGCAALGAEALLAIGDAR